jgi:ferredoxin-NADP reductase
VNLKLIEKRNETKSVVSFIFEPETPIKWLAGQYLIYNLPHVNQDLRGKMRFFTISSSPYEKNPTITTKIEKNSSSFKKTLSNLKIGGIIKAKGPDGDFVIENLNGNYVFIAGGIGITPFISIIKQLNHKNNLTDITLLYANKSDDIVFKKELEEIARKNVNLKLNYFISPVRIDEKILKKFINKKTVFYVSGPDPMVDGVTKLLTKLGLRKENIKEDYFSGYKSI